MIFGAFLKSLMNHISNITLLFIVTNDIGCICFGSLHSLFRFAAESMASMGASNTTSVTMPRASVAFVMATKSNAAAGIVTVVSTN